MLMVSFMCQPRTKALDVNSKVSALGCCVGLRRRGAEQYAVPWGDRSWSLGILHLVAVLQGALLLSEYCLCDSVLTQRLLSLPAWRCQLLREKSGKLKLLFCDLVLFLIALLQVP